ncbi:hypothetical protein AB0B31_35445 [Catellatospora citrea]|uniref:hypothetical protein n=1 Tax=Catellatospora citrea TaxID=53366 RepID=UPI00340423BD
MAAALATAAYRYRPDQPEVLDLLVEGAITSHRIGGNGSGHLVAKLAAMRNWVGQVALRSPANRALIDTTLAASVHATTIGDNAGRYLTALTLMDLASFAHAAVLYDHVLVLPGAAKVAAEMNKALGGPVLVPLPVEVETDEHGGLLGVGALLGNLFESGLAELEMIRAGRRVTAERADLNAIADGWSVLLDRRLSGRDVLADRLDEWSNWDSDGPWLVNQLVAIEGGPRGHGHAGQFELAVRHRALYDHLHPDRGLTRLISESNHRSYFNLRLSHLLSVPYIGSAGRLPFRLQLYRHAAFAHQRLLLHREIDRYRTSNLYDAPERTNVRLPAFLAIAVERAASPRDVLVRIGELRNTAAPLRRRRVEYEHALQELDVKTVKRIRTAIASDQTSLLGSLTGPVAAGIAAATAAAASPTTGLTVGLIGVLTSLGSLPAERREAIARRLLRPAEWTLTSTADQARAVKAAGDDIARIWGLSDDARAWLGRRVHNLSKLPPA